MDRVVGIVVAPTTVGPSQRLTSCPLGIRAGISRASTVALGTTTPGRSSPLGNRLAERGVWGHGTVGGRPAPRTGQISGQPLLDRRPFERVAAPQHHRVVHHLERDAAQGPRQPLGRLVERRLPGAKVNRKCLQSKCNGKG